MGVNVSRKTLILASREDEYATAPSMSSDTDTVLAYNSPIVLTRDTSMQDVQTLRATMSNEKQIVGRSLYNVSVETCLCPIGQDSSARYDAISANGARPYFSDLLVASGMSVTDSDAAGTSSAVYVPASDFPEASGALSCTVKAYSDGVSQQATGVYLSADFNLTAGQAPMITFAGMGVYAEPTNTAFPASPAYPLDTKTLVESEGLTISAKTSTGGTAVDLDPICRSMSFSTGTNIIERADVNSAKGFKGCTIISRAPTLSLVVEAEDTYRSTPVATNGSGAFFHNLSRGDVHAIDLTHSFGGDDNIAFSFPEAQLTSVNFSDDGGLRVYNLEYVLIDTSAAGDTDWSISFTRVQ